MCKNTVEHGAGIAKAMGSITWECKNW